MQIENEYGNIMGPYGAAGKAYINWCASMATSLNIGVPWIMCQQDDAPQPMVTFFPIIPSLIINAHHPGRKDSLKLIFTD